MEKFPNSNPKSETNENQNEIRIPYSVLDNFEKFWLENGKEIREIVDPLVERFTDEDAESIISLLVDHEGINARHAGHSIHYVLSKALDINTGIYFIGNSDPLYEKMNIGGFYSPDKDVVVIKKKDGLEFDLEDIEFPSGRLVAIAHEMFHGYQTKISKTDNPRADLYSKNDYSCTSQGLASSAQELASYFCQPVEAEAYYFEKRISDKLTKALKKQNN